MILSHTPGPWRTQIEATGDILITDEQDVSIARVYCQPLDPPEWVTGNARIMRAAPRLFDACDLVQRAWTGDGVDMATAVDACLTAISHANKGTDYE